MTQSADPRRPPRWRSALTAWVADLSPAAFAFVMATGIVSTALAGDGLHTAASALLLVGITGYAVLWAASLWRVARWRERFLRDLTGSRGFAFLTVVAASGVLASGLADNHHYLAAGVLLAIGVTGWLVLGYGVPLLLITGGRPFSRNQVDGVWFLWVVGTESMAVTAASLAPQTSTGALAGFASVCWAVGLLQYVLTAGLVLARLLLEPVTPRELVPPYWIFMGAAAIIVLAGARILSLPAQESLLLPRSFTLGLSMALWAFCSWLIPLLLALGVWRHVLHRVPLRYETSLWAMVFPVGMYGVATRDLGTASGTDWLVTVGSAETWVAAGVWAAVFLAMIAAAVRAVRRSPRPALPEVPA